MLVNLKMTIFVTLSLELNLAMALVLIPIIAIWHVAGLIDGRAKGGLNKAFRLLFRPSLTPQEDNRC